MLPSKFTIPVLSIPRTLLPKNGSEHSRRLIADYLNWIFGCGRSTSAAVLSLSFLGRERVKDCNLGVLGVALSSFI